MTDRLEVDGLEGTATIARDRYGIPHIRAAATADAWFAMGFASAQDRLFQMDYDRRRATGRWAEIAGQRALPADVLARRLSLMAAARADLEVMSDEVRAAFGHYAAGVNAVIASGPVPLECSVLGYQPEPWEPWHSVAAFKVRHVLMGLWQHKLAQAMILARSGRDALLRLDTRVPLGAALTAPSGERLSRLVAEAADEISAVEPYLGFLAEAEPGSNAWAVAGHRTPHGAAVICNDSHRALDTPNVYWQCHVTCDEFDVIGATFPGLPGFPHFGHNGRVAWAITHATADTQDLYVEWFDTAQPGRYRTPDGWASAERRSESISVRGADPVEIEVWRTRHGPVVHGDPRRGLALALRYTATDGPGRGFEALPAMLAARGVSELIEAQRDWVDPVNNLLAADVEGRIAYQARGRLPVRSSPSHRRLPVPGWTGADEWTAMVPFEQMPRVVDPHVGYLLTANNVICDGDEPYISYSFADPFRAERIRQRLARPGRLDRDDLADLQGDVTSVAATWTAATVAGHEPFPADDPAEAARTMLAGWDGELRRDSPEALLYGCFRRVLVEQLYRPAAGPATWEWMLSEAVPATGVVIRRSSGRELWEYLGGPTPPEGTARAEGSAPGGAGGEIPEVLRAALREAWADACAMAGPDPRSWRWGEHHRLVPSHPLSSLAIAWPVEMQAGAVQMGGDGDTVQAASYGWRRRTPFHVTGLSVYRQVVDLADPPAAEWVIPGGASGDPRSPHFADQLGPWADHGRIAMLYRPDDVNAATRATTVLVARGRPSPDDEEGHGQR